MGGDLLWDDLLWEQYYRITDVDGDRGCRARSLAPETSREAGGRGECLPSFAARSRCAAEGKTGRAGNQHPDEFGLPGNAGLDENLL